MPWLIGRLHSKTASLADYHRHSHAPTEEFRKLTDAEFL